MHVQQAKITLEAKLAEVKFGVSCKLDLPEKFKEKGLPYDRKFTIFKVCNPDLDGIVLQSEEKLINVDSMK